MVLGDDDDNDGDGDEGLIGEWTLLVLNYFRSELALILSGRLLCQNNVHLSFLENDLKVCVYSEFGLDLSSTYW